MLLDYVLKRHIRAGALTVIHPDGRCALYGGRDPGPAVTVRLRGRALPLRLSLNPYLAAGEAYVDGTLTLEEGGLQGFFDLLGMNLARSYDLPLQGPLNTARAFFRRLHQLNPAGLARRKVAHHYDLKDEFVDLFLDRERQYSCAYFGYPGEPLENAQENKLRHLAAKLCLRPGMKVLDIGCGWGGLARYLARAARVEVTGITLSGAQLDHARRETAKAGLAGRVRFALRDYREEAGSYDRIVSVGMFEHVGLNHYRRFFETLHHLLKPGGVALVHSIVRQTRDKAHTNPWIRKYIFPGGYIPALSEVLPAIETAKFWVADIEMLRRHYADTLQAWSRRFARNRARAAELYGERFCRMWEFYLAMSEMAFRHLDLLVTQIQLATTADAVPLTRDYISSWESGDAETQAAAQ